MLSNNRIQALPTQLGQLVNLKILLSDLNALARLPSTIGQCRSLRILNLASNNLLYIPSEIGQLRELRVLNLANNYLRFLPESVSQLANLSALWLSDNQKKPLIVLQNDIDPKTQDPILTCALFPQSGPMLSPVSAAMAAAVMSATQYHDNQHTNQANQRNIQQPMIHSQKAHINQSITNNSMIGNNDGIAAQKVLSVSGPASSSTTKHRTTTGAGINQVQIQEQTYINPAYTIGESELTSGSQRRVIGAGQGGSPVGVAAVQASALLVQQAAGQASTAASHLHPASSSMLDEDEDDMLQSSNTLACNLEPKVATTTTTTTTLTRVVDPHALSHGIHL